MFIQSIAKLPKVTGLPKTISIDTENKPNGSPEGLSIAWKFKNKPTRGVYIPLNHRFPTHVNYKNLPFNKVRSWLEQICERSDKLVFHNSAYDLTILESYYKIKLPIKKVEDTMLLHWDIDTERRHGLKEILKTEYGKEVITYKQATLMGIDAFAKYGEDDAIGTLNLYFDLMKVAKKHPKTYKLYREHDMEIVPLMQRLNYYDNAVRIDKKELDKQVELVKREKEQTTAKLKSILGDINFRSSAQLGKVLEQQGFPVEVKQSTGNYVLDEKALKKLQTRRGGAIIELILYFRGLEKLDNTYVSKMHDLLIEIEPDVWVISGYSFLQHGTRTGRFSSVDPNLQNMPRDVFPLRFLNLPYLKRKGKVKPRNDFLDNKETRALVDAKTKWKYSVDIRKLFIPMPGKVFIGADYSQLELRMMAHISRDPVMIDGYKDKDMDFHQFTCDGINRLVGKKIINRNEAKTINFFFQYGGYYKTLAKDLKITVALAKKIDEAYSQLFKVRSKFIKHVHSDARKSHFVQTILGRRRNVNTLGINENPDTAPNSAERTRRFLRRNNAENACISTIVSGSSADLIKCAMLEFYKKHRKELNIKLQVHDELLFEVDEDKADKYLKIVKRVMANSMELKVPIKTDAKIGYSWRDVH